MSNIDEMDEVEQSSAKHTIKLQDFLFICLNHWLWFVISLVICLGVAFFVLQRTAPTYERSAQIMIRMDSQGNPTSSNTSMLFELGINNNSTNVQNEIAMFSSPDLMRHAVEQLGLNTTYAQEGFFRDPELYGSTLPVNVTFGTMPEDTQVNFDLNLRKNGDYTITNVERKKPEDQDLVELDIKPIHGKVGTPVNTPIGRLTVMPGKAFNKIEDDMTILVYHAPVRSVAKEMVKSLSATPDKKMDNVVTLSFKSTSIEKATDVINALIDAYNQEWAEDKRQMAYATSEFIDERINVLQQELGSVDNDISDYKSRNMVPDVTAAANLYMNEASKATEELKKLRNQYYMIQYLHEYLQKNQANDKLLPTNIGITANGLNEMVRNYNEDVLERNSLILHSSESNPMVAEYDNTISAARQALIVSTVNEMAALNEQIRSQERMTGQAESRIASNPVQARYLLSVERQQKVKEELYLFLLQKREENQLNQVVANSNVRPIRRTDGPDYPVAPRKAITLAVAFLLGLLIPGGYLYIRELNINYVRGRKDIEVLSAPFAGEIPFSGKKEKSFKTAGTHKEMGVVAVMENSRNAINEAFRVVRANIEFMGGRNSGSKIIMFTSANPGSGKTYITYNLGKSFAIKGKKVVLVDLDMRKASLSKYVSGKSYGIADYLAGRVSNVKDIIRHPEDAKSMSIITVGTLPPNPTELLYSENLQNLLESLRQEYDYIFIDCPPVEVVADASIISQYCDSTIFVIRAGLFRLDMLETINDYYSKKTFPNMSIILNGTIDETNAYGSRYGGYRYGYKYGYHYGYGSKKGISGYYHEEE